MKKTKSIAEIWLDGELRLSFRRTFSDEMLMDWEKLRGVVEQVNITDESDALIWGCDSWRILLSFFLYNHKLQGVGTYLHTCSVEC
jgi:hypothetical protein